MSTNRIINKQVLATQDGFASIFTEFVWATTGAELENSLLQAVVAYVHRLATDEEIKLINLSLLDTFDITEEDVVRKHLHGEVEPAELVTVFCTEYLGLEVYLQVIVAQTDHNNSAPYLSVTASVLAELLDEMELLKHTSAHTLTESVIEVGPSITH